MEPRAALAIALTAILIATPTPPSVEASGSLIAPPGACPGQGTMQRPSKAQERTMLCLVDFARLRARLASLTASPSLDLSADRKGSDILHCDTFSHFACGRNFSYWIQEAGYTSTPCWRVGENLAWGTGEFASVRSIFRAWMRSPSHRANILGAFDEIGMSVQAGELEEHRGARVWVQHFGTRCGSSAGAGAG